MEQDAAGGGEEVEEGEEDGGEAGDENFAEHERGATGPHVVLSSADAVSETQYSIGGVVTLEPLASTHAPASRVEVSFRPVVEAPAPAPLGAAPAPAPPTAAVGSEVPAYRVEDFRRMVARNTPDALNDVFSLQLKFAETMLKLEKSVQVRDELLRHGGTTGSRYRREQDGQENDVGRQRNRRHRKRSFESGSSSDTSVEYREIQSGESFSSSAYSFSSLGSIPRRGQMIRVKYPNFGVSRATTAETLAPSSSGVDNGVGLAMTGAVPPISSGTTSTLSQQASSPDTLRDTAADTVHEAPHAPIDERPKENPSTPTTGSSVTTPSTGSDQKSSASSSKQVRFGDDAYSTPVLARKFNFDGFSIDEEEDEEKEEESILSFLGGSSVTSSELNNASFLRAFDRFRRELNAPRHHSLVESPLQQPLARKLFSVTSLASEDAPLASNNTALVLSKSDAEDQNAQFRGLDGLSVEELQERRRQLCLDIQAVSAQLVLNVGGTQDRTQGSESTKERLMALRDELKAVEILCKM
ncbi:unnamed protein product [Phytophthora fragariaefolia]|uniref:Unnamed protein product n=1 Tax=Phytophthora fragariaefolia TaxID=1490495 RepID=A0A9W6X822_9STRA|nr:unnamed protein product [Phytophthora fragariaefolia]